MLPGSFLLRAVRGYEPGYDTSDYTPIVRSLSQCLWMLRLRREGICQKFDIAYVLAKEKLAFTKILSICELEE